MNTKDSLISQMRKGALEYCVLALVGRRPRYSVELVDSLAEIPGLLVSEGTIYPLLSRLRRSNKVDTEWQEATAGPPRRYYRLTTEGQIALEQFRSEWARFRSGVDQAMGTGGTT